VICQPWKVLARKVRDAAVTILFLGGALWVPPPAVAAGAPPLPAKTVRAAPAPAPAPAATPIDFPTIVERYGPVVVNISGASGGEQRTSVPTLDGLDADDPVVAFFRRAQQQPQEGPPNPPRVAWGSGSGFIISPDGLILTTAHVAGHADEVTVKLTDRREFKAKVLATDPQSDAALLQIEAASNLPVVKLGDSSRVRVGEQLLTIGAPEGSDNTVTAGLLSATPRALADGTAFPFFQTDIAVNPDNSGGPVFNRQGEVVGINVQVYADGERYQALTFAIPINAALAFRRQSQGSGKVSHGSLGIEVQDIDPGLAAAFGLPRAAGALVTAVASAPASRGAVATGIKAGDVITQAAGKSIDRSIDLLEYAASLQPGTKTTLRLIRNKRSMTITVPVGTSDEIQAARAGPGATNAADRLGLIVHSLSDAERRASGFAGGLIVDGAAGPAANAGIQPGDMVLSVNGTPVASREELGTLVARAGKEVALLIQRDNVRSFVSLDLK
jgi:serine protease Do